MKINDLVFQYPGFNGPGICRLRTFATASAGLVILLTDLGAKSTGPSITNSIEKIAQVLVSQGYAAGSFMLIEHYEGDRYKQALFQQVHLPERGPTSWQSMPAEEVQALVGCDAAELMDCSLWNMRLAGEIDRVRNAIDPFMDFPYPGRVEVINRRGEIASGMVPKGRIAALVEGGAIEQDLQRLLKADLSIFGEVYASPHEEYICFSEFPVADGAVDFAVFTGRSRMDVVLIEVKGADFNLVNKDAYAGFSRNVNQAADQIRARLGHAYRNLDDFRAHVHRIRESAESGKTLYNAFIGPKGKLQVDPQKDINIRCIVIGGRTRDDLAESARRQDYESRFSPPIRIESWDTWLRRLQRQ
jgi:hypothetical protein